MSFCANSAMLSLCSALFLFSFFPSFSSSSSLSLFFSFLLHSLLFLLHSLLPSPSLFRPLRQPSRRPSFPDWRAPDVLSTSRPPSTFPSWRVFHAGASTRVSGPELLEPRDGFSSRFSGPSSSFPSIPISSIFQSVKIWCCMCFTVRDEPEEKEDRPTAMKDGDFVISEEGEEDAAVEAARLELLASDGGRRGSVHDEQLRMFEGMFQSMHVYLFVEFDETLDGLIEKEQNDGRMKEQNEGEGDFPRKRIEKEETGGKKGKKNK